MASIGGISDHAVFESLYWLCWRCYQPKVCNNVIMRKRPFVAEWRTPDQCNKRGWPLP